MPNVDRPALARHPWQAQLELVVAVPGIQGALLLTRDGLPVLTQVERLRRPETFVAMAAATLTAAEVMASQLNLAGPVMFRVDHEKLTIAGMAVGAEFVVVLLAEPGADFAGAFARVRAGAPAGTA